jgi:hypothetical protein
VVVKAPLASDTGPLLVVPKWLLTTSGVGARELQVYLVLAGFADVETAQAWPSRRTLAAACGVASVRTVDAAVERLVAAGALRVTRRRDAQGDYTSSVYTLLRVAPGGATERATGVAQRAAPGGAAGCATGRAASCTENEVQKERREYTPKPPRQRRPRAASGTAFEALPTYTLFEGDR